MRRAPAGLLARSLARAAGLTRATLRPQAYADATTLTDSDAFRSDFSWREGSSDYSSSYVTGSTATATVTTCTTMNNTHPMCGASASASVMFSCHNLFFKV